MEIDFMTLEVDGGFNNPMAVIAVIMWAVFPSLAVGWATLKFEPDGVGALRWFIAALLFGLTPVARQLIGTFLYARENPQIVSVAFWGGAGLLASPLAAMLLVTASVLLLKRLRHRPA